LPVDDRGHHLDVVVAQQTGHPIPEQDVILGDDYSHGSSARIVVGPPRGLVTERRPSSASTRRRRPRRPEPSGSAPPWPSSRTSSSIASSTRTMLISTRCARACLVALASASAATKYAALSTAGAGRGST